MSGIFLSYRHDDSQGEALHLFEDLRKHFGADHVFMDVTRIDPGKDFRKAIDGAVSTCDVLIVMIGKKWLDSTDDRGKRRIDDPEDFVRMETAAALRRDIPVIPVLLQGTGMPRSDQLPGELEALAWRNAFEIRHARWEIDVAELVKALRKIVNVSQTRQEPKAAEEKHLRFPITRLSVGLLVVATLVTGLIVAVNQLGLFGGKEAHKESTRQARPETGLSPKTTSSLVRDAAKATFFDDFSDDKLDPHWKILNHNPSKTTIQPKKGTLLIITERGSIATAATNLKNQYVLDLSLPKDNYEVIAKASLQIQSTNNSISLGLFKDEDNFLELIYWGRPSIDNKFPDGVDNEFYRTVSFTKEERGQRRGFSTEKTTDTRGPLQAPLHFLLKLERNGNEYTGYFARFPTDRPPENIDQVRWYKLGTHAWIDFDGKVSLWARNANFNIHGQGPPREVAAEFDFVLIREK